MKTLTAPPLQFHFVWRRHWLAHLVVISACVICLFFAHEFGHALVAVALGGRILSLNVLGTQWFPWLEYMPEFGFGGYTTWLIPFNLFYTRIIVASGSTGTLLIALVAVVALNLLRVRTLTATALAVISLYFTDSVLHLIPVLGRTSNSAPPWVRSFSETFYALLDLGVPGNLYIILVFIISIVILFLLVRGIRRARSLS